MPHPTVDVFARAVLFELRETYHVAEEIARRLVLRYPAVMTIEYEMVNPCQAARSLLLCGLEDGTLSVEEARPSDRLSVFPAA